jgi:HSP20 family molecular chaperone IbpA
MLPQTAVSLLRALDGMSSVPVVRGGATVPRHNAKVCDDQIVYEIALPGFKKEDVKVSVSPGRLDVSSDTTRDYSSYVMAGARVAPFSISFPMPSSATVKSATMADGLLYVTIQTQDATTIAVT